MAKPLLLRQAAPTVELSRVPARRAHTRTVDELVQGATWHHTRRRRVARSRGPSAALAARRSPPRPRSSPRAAGSRPRRLSRASPTVLS